MSAIMPWMPLIIMSALVGIMLWFIGRLLLRLFGFTAKPRKRYVCTHCESMTNGGWYTPGTIAIEIVLWLCFLVPGLVYSLWRLSARKRCCRACGSTELVPIDSPRGRAIVDSES